MKKFHRYPRFSPCLALALVACPWVLDQSVQAQCCWGSKPQAPYPVGSPYPVAIPAQTGNYSAGRPMIPVTPITPSNGAMTSYYGNYGMVPPTTGNILPNGFPQTVAAAMPTAAYDTQWQRTPVTYYRPVTQFDPNYGTTVTSLQPCTSYQYQAQRVPLVAPTPVGGVYAQASNQWPAINQPGYYPTGAANAYAMSPVATAAATSVLPASTTPVYPQVQYLPATGTVPTSSPNAPVAGVASSAVYYGNPAVATTQPLAANCPGGVCPPNLTPPNIPGASSITPMGPVTYLPANGAGTQNGVVPAGLSQPSSIPSATSGLVLPPSSATLDPASAVAPSLPPPPTTPSTPNTSLMPSSTTAPSTSSAGLWSDRDERVSKMVPMNRLPVVPIDRPVPSTTGPSFPTSRSVSSDPAAIASPFPGSAPRATLGPPSLLSTPAGTNPPAAKPLVAPEGFDGKPHWNPKLLPPPPATAEDKVALRSANAVK
ncbi:MAG: hypothetical protein ACKOAU_01160 [Pirellula sp.]